MKNLLNLAAQIRTYKKKYVVLNLLIWNYLRI